MVMTEILRISGTLLKKDLKRLTGTTRTGTVGPTTIYYAGVTAPIISAGVSSFTRSALHQFHSLPEYWLLLISTLIAAFAGICWYLIFMRWSYRNTHGRGDEASSETQIELMPDALILRRSHVTYNIKWPAVLEIQKKSGFVAIIVQDGHTILIPDHWFGKDKDARDAFYTQLMSYTQS